jgi:hypothetical protein
MKSASDLQDQIRRRAYELYEQRESNDGHEVSDWLQAESHALLQWIDAVENFSPDLKY